VNKQPEFDGLFDTADPLEGITARDVGPEIADELKLHADPPSSISALTGNLLATCRQWVQRYTVVSEDQATILAAWLLHTYAPEVAETTPYIHITAPEKACGKSRLMETLVALAANPRMSGGMTAAALVRCVDALQPTIFLDEMDAQMGGDKEYAEAIRGILNVGYRKGGTFSKCDGRTHQLREFNAYCPKCFAGIGKLPDTVASRSLQIEMRRKLPAETVAPFRQRAVKTAAAPIREKLDAWKNGGAPAELEKIEPAALSGLSDRQNDIAEPLLSIAQLAGVEWLNRLTAALQGIFKAPSAEDASIGVTLLSDIRTVFNEHRIEKITSKELAERLCEIEGHPWAEWNHGKSMTPSNLARLLKKHNIHSQKIRFGSEALNGYRRDFFKEDWARYCSHSSPGPEHMEQAASEPVKSSISETERTQNTNGTETRLSSCPRETPQDVPDLFRHVPKQEIVPDPHEQRTVPSVLSQSGGTVVSEVRI
jgi:hypothetical protein